jgi:hypothetical protein
MDDITFKRSVLTTLEQLKVRMNILIGIQIRQDEKMPIEKKILALKKMGMSYPEIVCILCVSSKTIAKIMKNKSRGDKDVRKRNKRSDKKGT